MKNRSLRLRYLAGYLLLLIPILIFSLTLYYSTMERSTQYICSASLQQFNYATENIAAILSRFESSAQNALSLEAFLQEDEHGQTVILNETGLCATLSTMESRLSPSVDLLLYLRGDNYIYSTEGKLPYHLWESQYTSEYSMPMSQLFTSLMSQTEPVLVPLQSAQQRSMPSGLACLMPFPTDQARSSCFLIYLIRNSILLDEFQNYLGNLSGDLYLYSDRYTELFVHTASEDEPMMPFSEMIKLRGVGAQEITYNGRSLMLLRASNSQQGLHCALLTDTADFYADLRNTQHIMTALLISLVVVICILAVWSTFFNYKPIGELVEHIAGPARATQSGDELALIQSCYDKSIGETERLSLYLTEMRPMIAQQLASQLIAGKITDMEDFSQRTHNADIPFSRPYTMALCLFPPMQEDGGDALDRCQQAVSRFQPAQCTILWDELPSERVLGVVVNFAAEGEDVLSRRRQLALQLSEAIAASGIQGIRTGVGCAYDSPLLTPDSFAEAKTAVQFSPMPPQEGNVYLYETHTPAVPGSSLPSLAKVPAMAVLAEGIRRGETSVAQRALHDLIDQTAVTESFVHLRFSCAEILSAMLQQASSLGLTTDAQQVSRLMSFKSQAEFTLLAAEFLAGLCGEMRLRAQQEERQMTQRVLDCILAHYKEMNMSIQMVSELLDIPKSQITLLLREAIGQNFVQYISYLRMNEFKRLLLETDKTIKDCVMEIGYGDVPNFLRKFKSIEGMTPGQYRAAHEQSDV